MRLKGYNIGTFGPLDTPVYVNVANRLGANHVRYTIPRVDAHEITGSEWEYWIVHDRLPLLDHVLDTAAEIGYVVAIMQGPGGDPIREFLGRKWRYTAVLEDPSLQAILINVWRHIASKYKDDPRVKAYDILNEPMGAHREWRALAQKLIDNIREVDPFKPIIVQSVYGSMKKLRKFKKGLRGANIIYSAHMYHPLQVTHEGVASFGKGVDGGSIYPIGNTPYPGRWKQKHVKKHMMKVRKWSKRNNLKIYIGEFGVSRWSGYPHKENRINWMKDVWDLLDKWNWHYAVMGTRGCSVWEPESPFALPTPIQDNSNPHPYAICEILPEYPSTTYSQLCTERMTR